MTKEKILKSILSEKFGYDFESDWWTDELKTLFDEINSANDIYHDLQNNELIKENKHLQASLLDVANKSAERVKELESELNELKERHKKEAIDFANFICSKGYTLIQKNINDIRIK